MAVRRVFRGILVAAWATAFGASAAYAQDAAATAADAIIARKTVMEALSDKMDDIEGAISAGKVNRRMPPPTRSRSF
jgi:hypothetical protein